MFPLGSTARAVEVRVSLIYRRAISVEAAPMQNETILYNATTKGFCVLNPSAAMVWNSLETPQSADVLAAQLCHAFRGVSTAQAIEDVELVLTEFKSLSLVELQS